MLASTDVRAFFDSRPIRSLQVRVFVLCALVLLLDGLDTQVIGYLGPALSKDWHLSRTALAPVFSAGLAGLMGGLLLVAPLADRIGRKWTIGASSLLFGVFTLLTAAAHGVSDLILYRVLAGVGLGGAMPNAIALTGEYCPARRRSTLVVLTFCGFSLGSILGGGLAASMLERFGWRAVFIVGGLLPLALVPVLVAALPESLQFLVLRGKSLDASKLALRIDPSAPVLEFRSAVPDAGVPVAELFSKDRAVGTLLLWAVFFLNLLDFYFLQNWLPTIFTDSGLSQETAAWITTLISAGGIVAGLLSGPLMDRYGAYPVLAGLYLLGTACVVSIGVASSLGAVIASTFCAGFCVSGGQKTVNALASEFYPTAMRSTGVGWALGVGRLGSVAGPAAGAFLLVRGWPNRTIFQMAALPMLGAAVFICLMGLRYARSQAERLAAEAAPIA